MEADKFAYGNRLCKPSQVLLITYSGFSDVFLVVVNSKKMADMTIIVKEDADFEGFWDKNENKKLNETFGGFHLDNVRPSNPSGLSGIWTDISYVLQLPEDPRHKTNYIAEHFFRNTKIVIYLIERKKQSKKIESTVNNLKRNVEALPNDSEFKRQIMRTIINLDSQMKELDKRVDEEVLEFRKLVGNSEGLLDWKMYSGDMDFLKKTHVTKEIFTSEIKRLEDIINIRIDSIQSIIEAHNKVLSQQNEFMKQQADVMKQQSSFINWIKYATILVPIAVVSVPIIEIVLRHFLVIP